MKVLLLSILVLNFMNFTLSKVDLSTYYKIFIKNNGYNLEEHNIKTEDGYILSIWHLTPKTKTTKVAYFQHGLVDTAWCFFQMDKKSLPFLLLERGFDVWLGNSRGNIFSNKKKMQNKKYYEFTMDDKVKYDLPATIKYIQSKTNGKKITYIGHSQGTTIFLMLYMHNPSLVESSFDHFIPLGTVPNIAHATFSPIKILDAIYKIMKLLHFKDGIFNLDDKQRMLISNFCKKNYLLCKKFFEKGTDIKPTHRTDYSKLYKFLYYYPGGTSKLNLLHWSQIHTQKKLVYYNPNYDKEKTSKPYNINNLKKWKIKALIVRTDSDTFSSYQDVTNLYNTIEDKTNVKILDIKNYGHLDVLASDSAYNDIFIPIINFLKK